MIKRICDVCGKEINRYKEHEWRDSKTASYRLIHKEYGTEYETDICNECLKKVIALTRGKLADMEGEE